MALAWTLHEGDRIIVQGTTIQVNRKVELQVTGSGVDKVEFSNSRLRKRDAELADAPIKNER